MKLSRPLRSVLAIASGFFLALSFPDYNLPLLAWGAIALLILASVGAGLRDAPLYGFLHGIVFYPTCLPWIAVVIRQYGDVEPFDAAGVVLLIGIAGGIILASFSMSLAWLSRKSSTAPFIIAPFLWVTLEFARTHLPYIGFPWNLTGYAASGNLAFVQLAPLTGIFGLSFVIAAFNALLAWAVITRSRQAWTALGTAAAVLILIALLGPHFVPKPAGRYVAIWFRRTFRNLSTIRRTGWTFTPGNWTNSKKSAWMRRTRSRESLSGPKCQRHSAFRIQNSKSAHNVSLAIPASIFFSALWLGNLVPGSNWKRRTAPCY